MKNVLWLIAAFLFITQPNTLGSELAPETCLSTASQHTNEVLTQLFRLDHSFHQVYVHRIKFIETVYNPLWQARIKQRDSFSASLRAEGDMLYGRYHHQAQVYFDSAKVESKRLWESFSRLSSAAKNRFAACPTEGFINCVEVDRSKALDLLRALKKLLKSQDRLLRTLSHQATISLNENPSEHYPFPDRYQDAFNQWQYKIYPQYLRESRALREFIELDSLKKCCEQCNSSKLGINQDAVISQIRPSLQGTKGVSGEIVNNASVLKAFTEADEKEERS